GLGFELTADGERSPFAEEILAVVDRRRLLLSQARQIESRHLEHLPGPFAVAGGDDRRMDVNEATRLKKLVDCCAQRVAHAGNRSESVRPRPQMGDIPQKLETVPLLLQRILLGVSGSVNRQLAGVHFHSLTLGGGSFKLADDANAAACRQLLEELGVTG